VESKLRAGDLCNPASLEKQKMNRVLFSIVVGFALGGSVRPAQSGCNHLYYRAHHVQAVVVQPQVFYSVGDSLLIEAAVEKAFQRQALKQAAAQPAQAQPGTLSQTASVLSAKCARCHSGNEPAGGVDFRFKIDDFAFRRTVEMLGEGINVPEKMAGVIKSLTPEERGAITSEMMRLPSRRPDPVQVPPPPAPGELR
jgi:mono/diheme cytochrome c family protein